jgi:hypothetical protein
MCKTRAIVTVPNTGSYTDSIGAGGNALYTYKVCEAHAELLQ